jgi:DNA-binding SARP family transcriptional activator/tetratricopeptide (TPR) repeat protein
MSAGAEQRVGAPVEFEILLLGPVALRVSGELQPLGSPKERLMLAALAVAPGQAVSHDTLIHRIWDDSPPGKPRASLHVYATRLRRLLRDEDRDSPDPLPKQQHAYTLEAPLGHVDAHRYQQMAAHARALSDSGDDAGALTVLQEAESLWRGEPLAGLPGLWADGIRTHLLHKRLSATLTRVEIELRLGRYADLVADLAALWEQHPTDETVAAHLMTANYGCGRQSDALRVYDVVRHRLSEELGTDPGEALTRHYRLILQHAPVHELLPRPDSPAGGPHTLPRHGELVGRQAELRELQEPAESGSVITLQSVSGMGGVGKTLLALHLADRLAPRYPDGQVHLDLRAHAQDRQPLDPREALTVLLKIFDVPGAAIPDDLESLSALWRSLLSTRRAVIILDDVAGPEQVRPLLPGASPSLMVITSRRRLVGLAGVRSVVLDVLPKAEAVAMFRSIAGGPRTQDSGEVEEVVRLCGNLPLALQLTAGRLLSRPSWDMSHLIGRLSRDSGRLCEIRDGFQEIGRTFAMSYESLSSGQQHVFRLLSLHLGPDFDVHASAALTGLPLADMERMLEVLLDSYLLTEPAPDRYRFHDLLREFARDITLLEDSEEIREEALQRLIGFYVHASDTADRQVYARRPRIPLNQPDRPPAPHRLPALGDARTARKWFAQEYAALASAEHHSRSRGRPREAASLAHALAGFLEEEGHWKEAQVMHTAAAAHWAGTGEQRAEAYALIDLGNAWSLAADYEQALAAGRRARTTALAAGDAAAELEACHLLGVVHWNLGLHQEAVHMQEQTLRRRLTAKDAWQIARARNNLAITHIFLGNHSVAMPLLLDAISGFRESGDILRESKTLNNLSDLYQEMGDKETARQLLTTSLKLSAESNFKQDLASAQVNLANTMEIPAEFPDALGLYREALHTFRRLGDRRNVSITLHRMGIAFEAAGDDVGAVAYHRQALDIARAIGATHEEVQSTRHLGAAELRLGIADSGTLHLKAAAALGERPGAA